jgi:peptide/nickel transport system substrate-binding protein
MKRLISSKNKRKAISRLVSIIIIVIILIVAATVAAVYYLYTPTNTQTPLKDTIIIGTTDSVQTTIDPADAYDYFGINIIQNLGDGLADYVPGGTNIVPALATSWSMSADGLTWTFNLRQGVKFADGTPFNASVVKYSMDREFAIDEAAGPFAGAGYDGIIKQTVVTGTYQVQFVLNAPFSAFLSMAAFTPMYPVNPNVSPMRGIVNYTQGNLAASNPNGLGHYVLTKWERTAGKDIEIDLQANPNFWNSSDLAKTKNIIIKFYSDDTTLLLALENHEIDTAYRQLTANEIVSLKSNSNFKVWVGPGQFIQYLVFNTQKAPFNQLSVRQAVAAAINRSLITEHIFLGQAEPLYSMIPIGMFSHTDAYKSKYGEANITYAQQLLTQAGYSTSNKLSITLTYPTGHYTSTDGIGQALKQSLEATGMISVSLNNYPWSDYKARTQSGELSAYIYGWYPDFIDPYDYTYPFLPPNGAGFLNTGFVDSNINSLLTTVAGTSNVAQQQSLYEQLQSRLADQAPMVPLFQGTSIAVSTPKVSGIVLDPTTIFRYWLLSETT